MDSRELSQEQDIELMRRSALDERPAFGELVEKYQKQLLNYFRSMGARMDEAEDMTQETFVRVWNYRGRYKPTGRFVAFLFVLARHTRADAARRGIRRPEVPSETLEYEPDKKEGGGPAQVDARLDVERALGSLSDKLRDVVVMNVFGGLEYRDIAEALEIPLGTVKSRMHLAMNALREVLDASSE